MDSVSCLHKLETKNYACYKLTCPQHNDANRGTCPPSFIAFNKVDGMKVRLQGQVIDLTGILQDLIKDSNWNFSLGDLVSFFNELDTRQETLLRFLVSFFNELDTRQGTLLWELFHFFSEVDTINELSSYSLVSFFNEVDTRQGTILVDPFHFLTKLTQ